MRRLVLGLVLALSAPAPNAAAAAAEVEAEFKLPASNGLRVEVEARGNEVALAVLDDDRAHRSGRYTAYLAKGETLETGVEASFGSLGQISFQFEPASSQSGPGGAHCSKQWIFKDGFFEGEARFRGENGYVTVDTHRVRGELKIHPCREASAQTLAAAAKPRRETGALLARAKDGRLFYAIGETDRRHHQAYTGFHAQLLETHEGLRIARLAYASLEEPGRFHYDHQAGTATVQPPGPFSGQATFARSGANPRQKGSWRGDLSVRLLGHEPINLTGPDFRTVLLRHSPFYDE